jgi:hypothetical protein
MVNTTQTAMTAKLTKLARALANGPSQKYCLRLWSEFIRERDGHRCVDCHANHNLSAHHICRKSFFGKAQFQTGNGITLCKTCHKEPHEIFNARPDLTLPIDAQGGERLDLMERLYSILTDDAVERDIMIEKYYYLSDEVLAFFKRMQGYDQTTYFPGSRIEQAFLILAELESAFRRAIAEANGVEMPNRPLLPGGLFMLLSENEGQPKKVIAVSTYKPRSGPICET